MSTPSERVVDQPRESNAAVFFVKSCGSPPFDAQFSPFLCMYPMPTIAFYGKGFLLADLMLAAFCNPRDVPMERLPKEVADTLISNEVVEYDFFWCVSDVSGLLAVSDKLNLVHHAWLYKTQLDNGYHSRFRMADLYPMGAFTYEGSGIVPTAPACLPFQCLDRLRVSVHAQGGGMCCSPNNARFALEGAGGPVKFMWTVVLRPMRGGRPTACVSLQWLVTAPAPGVAAAIAAAKTLRDLVPALDAALPGQACCDAVRLLFAERPPGTTPWRCVWRRLCCRGVFFIQAACAVCLCAVRFLSLFCPSISRRGLTAGAPRPRMALASGPVLCQRRQGMPADERCARDAGEH